MRAIRVFIVIALATGCHSTGSSVATDLAAPPDLTSGARPSGTVSPPSDHRATPMACPARPATAPCPYMNSGCATDADCTAGLGGRCSVSGSFCACSYDTCNADSDCPTGQDCACRLTFRYTNGNGPNQCVPANCVSDADCTSGLCSPSNSAGACQSVVAGYYCHTAQDECGVDADCVITGPGYPACVFRPELGHWACVLGEFCAG
jgi:hypothetical protein